MPVLFVSQCWQALYQKIVTNKGRFG
jgi:hypothetical protein